MIPTSGRDLMRFAQPSRIAFGLGLGPRPWMMDKTIIRLWVVVRHKGYPSNIFKNAQHSQIGNAYSLGPPKQIRKFCIGPCIWFKPTKRTCTGSCTCALGPRKNAGRLLWLFASFLHQHVKNKMKPTNPNEKSRDSKLNAWMQPISTRLRRDNLLGNVRKGEVLRLLPETRRSHRKTRDSRRDTWEHQNDHFVRDFRQFSQLATWQKDRFCSFPHRHGEATGTPETRDETRGSTKTIISYETSGNFHSWQHDKRTRFAASPLPP